VTPVLGVDRKVEIGDLVSSFGPSPDHATRLKTAHACAERFAGHALPEVLPHHYGQGVQRLAEWLQITGRDPAVMPAPDEIPAVVRYHWMVAGA
jgi:hypothetical protein